MPFTQTLKFYSMKHRGHNLNLARKNKPIQTDLLVYTLYWMPQVMYNVYWFMLVLNVNCTPFNSSKTYHVINVEKSVVIFRKREMSFQSMFPIFLPKNCLKSFPYCYNRIVVYLICSFFILNVDHLIMSSKYLNA